MSSTPESKPPTPKQFYIEYPLYEEYAFLEGQDSQGWMIKYSSSTLDAYCPECRSHSIFSPCHRQVNHEKDAWARDHLFEVVLKCSRNKDHELFFLFKVHGRTMQKIGQFPSLATLNLFDVRQYASALPAEAFREFTRAIGLAAHGVGVGSFVYLRRIFEGLIEQAHLEAAKQPTWDEESYGRSRVSEKISLLQDYLPAFLVENRLMYGILSKGIHELTEAECLKAFPILKIGIEIILDAKLRAVAEKKKLQQAANAIQRLANGET